MNLTRVYKLWKLNIPIDSKHLIIFEFVESKLLNLQKFEIKGYPKSVFFMNFNGEYILQIFENKNKYLYVRYPDFWEVLEDEYKLEFSDIQLFLQILVENIYKTKVDTTKYKIKEMFSFVEESYKNSLNIIPNS